MRKRSLCFLFWGTVSSASILMAGPANGISFSHIPLHFEPNRGQNAADVRFSSRSGDIALYLRQRDMVLTSRSGSMLLQFEHAKQPETLEEEGLLPGKSDYFLGSDPTQWRTGVPQFERVAYRGIYPGIDAIFYGNVTNLEYDLDLAPQADPRQIQVRFRGARLHLEENGDLTIDSAFGRLTQHRPHSYQMRDGKRVDVASSYVLLGRDRAGLRVGEYDRDRPLTIDPVLSFAGLVASYGSTPSGTNSIAVDSSGNVFVAGAFTWPTNVANGPPSTHLGTPTGVNVSIVELDATGRTVLYSVLLGGGGVDTVAGMVLGPGNVLYLTGGTGSTNFPVTSNALQTALPPAGMGCSFLMKLSTTQGLLYSTYFTSTQNSGYGVVAKAVAVDSAGNAYITGQAGPGLERCLINRPSAEPVPPLSPSFWQTTHWVTPHTSAKAVPVWQLQPTLVVVPPLLDKISTRRRF
jgi:Beta-propeller repeat